MLSVSAPAKPPETHSRIDSPTLLGERPSGGEEIESPWGSDPSFGGEDVMGP